MSCDAAGNLLQDATVTVSHPYTRDAQGRMTSISVSGALWVATR
jgi:YD repeat-containing protein